MQTPLNPAIRFLDETHLIGLKQRMSFARNTTMQLWQSFMPRRQELTQMKGNDLFSVEQYPDTRFFEAFDPTRTFDKWAAIEVDSDANAPEGMDTLVIPEGNYAVFHYVGKASEASAFYQYIYGEWLAKSAYKLDDRPHFARMGTKYKGEAADSEEEIWIPVSKQ